MLRVAVPNKGGLAGPGSEILREAGYRQRADDRDLVHADTENELEFSYLRPRDIATYVGQGTLDVGITGRDLLLDSGAPAEEVIALGFARSTFRWAARPGTATRIEDLEGLRVATSLGGLVETRLAEAGVRARVVRLEGAVESAIRLGVADVIADVVETGTTLRQAGLELFGDPILSSEAVLVRRSDVPVPEGLDALVRRLEGVLVARTYVMVDYNISADLVDRAGELTPGLGSPTVSPLRRSGWVAVRSMVPRREAHRVLDDLWEIGARAILVTDIHACRL